MKTNKRAIRIVNAFIFATCTSLGFVSGMLTHNYRSGVIFGIAIGLIGIIGYLYYLERHHRIKSIPVK